MVENRIEPYLNLLLIMIKVKFDMTVENRVINPKFF